jgi:polyhydroxybutyrate depolymerase
MCSKRVRWFLIAGLAFLLILCASAVALALSTLGPAASCRNPANGPARPGLSARTLVSGGLERCYLLYVPASRAPSQPAPLVLSLHGFAGNAKNQKRSTGWDRIADRESLVVVYPEGTSFPQRWNAADLFSAESVDDVQFFRDVIADVAKAAPVDLDRVYVNGMSNGGSMTHRIACELADIVTAIGTVAAVPTEPPNGCTPSRPVPVIAFHGTDDPLVNYHGGSFKIPVSKGLFNLSMEPVVYSPVETWISGWAERNGCDMVPVPIQGAVGGIHYASCRDGAEVVLYTVDGGGHTWPGGPPIPLVGKTSTDIDASETMWAFFQAHLLDRTGGD